MGICGEIEGFLIVEMFFVMFVYFLGFFGGLCFVFEMICCVGYVRVFVVFGFFIFVVLIVFLWFIDLWVWMFCCVVIGFGFCGVYVIVESWFNNVVINENCGKMFFFYMYV